MTFDTQRTLAPSAVRRATATVFAVFVLNGFIVANWVSRIPTIRDELRLEPGQIGLILFVGSVGSLCALPLAGPLVTKIGSARAVLYSAIVLAVGMAGAVLGVAGLSAVALAAGLFVAMVGVGAWDVAMNFEGALVERADGRAIMPRLHGGFSIGTVFGAGVGALAMHRHIPVPVHLGITVGATVGVVVLILRGFLPRGSEQALDSRVSGENRGGHRSFARAWLEPRTLMVGLTVLAAAMTEGAANDWLALAVVDGFDVPNATGALGLTIFVLAMTVMRFAGTALLDRYGRVKMLGASAALAIVGLVLFAYAPTLPLAFAGGALWALGVSLGFPIGVSAASDEPLHAAARLSVVTSIGYSAFLVGPPLLGLLAEQVGYRNALLALLVPQLLSLFAIRAAAPPPGAAAAGRGPDAAASDHP